MGFALIIDDNQMNIDVLELLLSREGIVSVSVRSLSGWETVVDSLNQVDIVFLDLEFPGEYGPDILPDLRRHPRLQSVPVIAYTVNTNQIDSARQMGFQGFLGKPLRQDHFPETIERILRGEGVWEV